MSAELLIALGTIVLVTAVLSGLVGAGGTIVMVPLALYLLPVATGVDLGAHVLTSLGLVQGVASGLGGAVGRAPARQLNIPAVRRYGIVIAIAALSGGYAAAKASSFAILLAFAIASTAAALLLWWNPTHRLSRYAAHQGAVAAALFGGVGLLGGLAGVGAGFLTVPILLYWLGIDHGSATATGLAFTCILCIAALVARAWGIEPDWRLAAVTLLASFVGATSGSFLSLRISSGMLRTGLAVVVTASALSVWVKVFAG